ncbi:MAG: cytochrome c biogenesis protein CcsA [Epsilonproteobacteria bacterium]|nr:cytochrome c biogenesis protein CcsA [Campylobacterota bacterium]
MLQRLSNLLFSLPTTVIFALIYMFAQIYATLGFSSDADAWLYVYGRGWFEAIQWILAINLIGVMYKYKTYKKKGIFVLHLSIIIIFIGAGITRYFGKEGVLHLRVGEASDTIVLQNKANPSDVGILDMGFKIRLDKFVMHKYPGSTQPSSYDSYVSVIDKDKTFPYHIYMNHILVYKGFRVYQMAYDPDEKGSILLVGHDPGMYVTYLGYLLMAIGFIMSVFESKSRFRMTARKLKESGLFAILLMLFVNTASLHALTLEEFATKSKAISNEFAKGLVQFNGRIEPIDTLDLDFIHKITKKAKLHNMNYNQLVVGMLTYPEIFTNIPLIYVGNPTIRKLMHLKGKYATYNQFFNQTGDIKYIKQINLAMQTPDRQRTQIQREWLKLNERIYVAYMIFEYKAFAIFPSPNAKNENYKWYSFDELNKLDALTARFYANIFKQLLVSLHDFDINQLKQVQKKIYKIQTEYSAAVLPSKSRVKMEILYNHLQIFPALIGIYSLLGIIAIFIGFFEVLKARKLNKTENALIILGWLALLAHTANMLLRWYISGHAPWSNAYESIVFIAWGSAFASLMFFKRSMLALGAGLFMAGMFMMVAHLNNIDPQITNMVPVLKSYWLLIHVAVITSSYGFLAVGSMLGLLNMILFALRKYKDLDFQIKEINNIIYLSLWIGLALLSVGTFLGGVWANESWGRYWSWDPKETWSLITMIAYAIVIHSKMIPKMKGEFVFSLLAFLTFFFVLMTYFGVNFYIAQGLHAYGRGEGDATWFNVLKAGIGAWASIVVAYTIMAITKKGK